MDYTLGKNIVILVLLLALIYVTFKKVIIKKVARTFKPDGDTIRLKAILFDNTPYSIIATDDFGVVRVWNRSAELKFLYTADQAIGKNIRDLIIPEEFKSLHDAGMRRWRESKSSRLIEAEEGIKIVAVDKNGTRFPVHLKLIGIADDGFTFVGAYARDISKDEIERKALIDKVAFLDENHRLLQAGGWEWDLDTGITEVDSGFRHIFNIQHDLVVTAPVLVDLIYPKDQLNVASAVNKGIREGVNYTIYFRRLQADGELIWIESKAYVNIKEGEDEVHKVRGTIRNIGIANDTDDTYKNGIN